MDDLGFDHSNAIFAVGDTVLVKSFGYTTCTVKEVRATVGGWVYLVASSNLNMWLFGDEMERV
ncbi:MAG: hypothetical protein QM625_04980 [Ralstonia sp.]|uniref:hypothetical protein n=1 Tax=Ralstonia TaxID=48736 RepID=UPI0015C7E91B|nr:hypothetical protein [Ralstonia pickettii]MBA9877445.1 hypothetical protein [Ralstonia pickettii]MBA9881697.1 hypothetical protein [Ralstonia pickettii]MBA9887086.1 hypothetical protein [Ralstonia pickettii]MBA9891814.1 hypothetical protein [Ralstonia pickettii]MBA9923628.1 hypothetical protein [Ralstonia pickettii]